MHITLEMLLKDTLEPRHEKTCLRGCFRPGKTQTACTATEDNYRLEISDIETAGAQADLRLLLFAYGINRFSRDEVHLDTIPRN